MTGHIQGIRYSCRDDFKTARPVTLEYKIERRDTDYWLKLKGGPTGYESARIFMPVAIQAFKDGKPWWACFGTKSRWDRLIIPAAEMLRIIDKYSPSDEEHVKAWNQLLQGFDMIDPNLLPAGWPTKNKEEESMAKTQKAKPEEKSLVPQDEMSLVPSPEAFKELQVNLEGIDPVFPAIKIIHQGQIFEMPDGLKPETFRGVIIDTNAVNAYWKISFDDSGGGDPPDCFSPDSIRPDMGLIEPESPHCKTCDKNQFGSEVPKEEGEEVFGKACKNMRRVHVLVEGSFLPYRLSLSPANLKPANLFLTVLASQGFSYLHVVTEFSLKEAQNKKGIKYSEIVFKKLKVIESKDIVAQLKSMKATLLDAMRGQIVTPEEYDPAVGKGREAE